MFGRGKFNDQAGLPAMTPEVDMEVGKSTPSDLQDLSNDEIVKVLLSKEPY